MCSNNEDFAIKRFHIVVSGRVQAVGYRYFTRERAQARGITGWVRNCYNGDVEIEAQGTIGSINLLINDLREGPLFSHVTDLQHNEIPAKAKETSFIVKM